MMSLGYDHSPPSPMLFFAIMTVLSIVSSVFNYRWKQREDTEARNELGFTRMLSSNPEII